MSAVLLCQKFVEPIKEADQKIVRERKQGSSLSTLLQSPFT